MTSGKSAVIYLQFKTGFAIGFLIEYIEFRKGFFLISSYNISLAVTIDTLTFLSNSLVLS
jgi:hypothetical protein